MKRIAALWFVIVSICAFMTACGGGGGDAPVLSSQKAISAYVLAGVSATIDETAKTISVVVPALTDVSALAATFTTTGVTVKVGLVAQTSGVTLNNFSSPVVYTVTAQDGSTANYTVTVTAAPAVWHHPLGLSDNISIDGEDATHPSVAADAAGNIIIVWYQYDASGYLQIFKSEYRNGLWSHPASLSDNISPDNQNAYNPRVAMDSSGNAIVAWLQYSGANWQIFKSEYRNGVWTHPSSVTDNISPDGQDAWSPRAAIDDNGNAIIVWRQSDGSKYQIFKSEYRSGAWTYPSGLSDNISPDNQHAYNPRVAMDNNGNAMITWYQSDGSSNQIFKSEYRSGAWTHPSSLADNISPDGQNAWDPQVAMDNNNNAIITWWQYSGSNFKIYKSEYRSGTWTHPSGLTDNISPGNQDAVTPQVAMDSGGNALITWHQSDGTYSRIYKSEYRSSVWTHPWGGSDNISPDGQNAFSPQAVMNDNGNALIIWRQSDGSASQIFKSEYRSGSWTHPLSLSDHISPSGQNADYPQAAMSGNDAAVIAWQQYDGEATPVWQIFKSEYR